DLITAREIIGYRTLIHHRSLGGCRETKKERYQKRASCRQCKSDDSLTTHGSASVNRPYRPITHPANKKFRKLAGYGTSGIANPRLRQNSGDARIVRALGNQT